MRITPVSMANRRNLTPQNSNNVSFGYFADKPRTGETKDEFFKRTEPEEKEITRLLPPLDKSQVELLRNHGAVIFKRDGDKVYGELNRSYKNADKFLSLSGEDACTPKLRELMYCLGDLQDEENFSDFWHMFTLCRADELNMGKPTVTSSSDSGYPKSTTEMDAWDVAQFHGGW